MTYVTEWCVQCKSRPMQMRDGTCVECWKANYDERERRAAQRRRWPIRTAIAAWIIFAVIIVLIIAK